jgi:formylglycine-generating enzyme required for sulfatase activity
MYPDATHWAENSMKLTGQKVQQICDALIDAYPTRDLLRMMVRVELDENLEEIAGGENQNVVVFNLVSWAERDGRIDELITRAHRRTPGNEALKQLAAERRAQAPPGAEPGVVSPLAGPSVSPAERSGPASVDLFLSYSRRDSDAMHQVQEALREAGLSVWTDEGLEPGTQSWKDAIAEAVKQAYALVVLLSPSSSQSTWVKNEVGFAQTLNKRIFPVLIAGEAATAVPIDLINAQWVDGRTNLDRAVTLELLPALRRHQTIPEPRHVPPPVPARQEVSVAPVAESPAALLTGNAAQKSKMPGGARTRGMVIWIPLAILAGALGLLIMQRFVVPPQPPAPTASQTPAAPVAGASRTNPKDGAEYVYVPPGPFLMGSAESDALASSDEAPQMTVNLDGFWIMRTEVTNGHYKRCVEDNGACTEPENERWNDPAYADHPVTTMTWQQANAYAAWAGGRLPTEAEWEKACRGTEGGLYPWGDAAPTADLANYDGNAGGTTPVGQYSPQGDSPYGLVDMAGSVWEWVSSQYRPYPYDSTDGREDLEGDAPRSMRGGSWDYTDADVRCAFRANDRPENGYGEDGFRLVSSGS